MIGVTGATGALGGLVASALAAKEVRQRLIVRDPSRAPSLPLAEVAVASYADSDAARGALAGIDVLFMVSGSEAPDRLDQHRAFIDAAAAAGVRQVVYTSFFGAAPECTFTLGRDHWATEQHLRDSGLSWTFLRDNFYLEMFPLFTGDDDVLRGPAGDGRVSAVSRVDVARVAEVVLLDAAAHAGATYDLTGPASLSLHEIAGLLGAAAGRPVTYHEETVEEAYASRRRWPAEPWQYDAWVSTYTAIAAGECAGLSDAVRRLTGRSPLGLAEVLGLTDPSR